MMRVLILVFFSFLMACQNKPCREIQHQKEAQKIQAPGATQVNTGDTIVTPTLGAGMLKVKVYKPDGSLQCGMGQKIALDVMEKELKGLTIYSRSNRNDGLMRIQVCGAPTGNSNVYEISRNDLDKALKLGFKEWTYTD